MLVNEHLSWRRRLAAGLRRDALIEREAPDRQQRFDQQSVDRAALVVELRKLPPRERAVLVLRYLEDYTVGETAVVLACGESTVRAYTSRALARLRVTLPEASTRAPASSSRRPHSVKDRHAH